MLGISMIGSAYVLIPLFLAILGFLVLRGRRPETIRAGHRAPCTMTQTAAQRYSRVAIFLHWTSAVLIAVLIGLGWYMLSIEGQPGSAWYFDLHKSLGITFALLVGLRVAWRMRHAPGSLPATLRAWQARAAKLSHAALYILMILLPITGYLGALFGGSGVAFFDVATPGWAARNDTLKEQFLAVHSALAWTLVVLIGLHIVAALKHLLIDKDGVFQRILPR